MLNKINLHPMNKHNQKCFLAPLFGSRMGSQPDVAATSGLKTSQIKWLRLVGWKGETRGTFILSLDRKSHHSLSRMCPSSLLPNSPLPPNSPHLMVAVFYEDCD